MKGLLKFIGYIFLLLFIVLLAGYIALQTRWGASYASQFLSKFTPYNIKVGIMGHQFSEPGKFIFQDITIASNNKDLDLDARQIVVDINWRHLFSGEAIQRLTITQGNLSVNFTDKTTPLPLSAKVLQFENSQIQLTQGTNTLQVAGFTGGITPWKPTVKNPFGYGDFRFTTNQMMVNSLPFRNVAITGKLQEKVTDFSQVSGYLNNGSIAGKGKWFSDGSITIDNLSMNKVGWQNDLTFDALFDAINSHRTVQINQLQLTNVDIQGRDWALSGLSSEIDQISLVRGSWSSPKSHINFNVEQLVIQDQQVDTLIGELSIDGDNLNIDKLSGYYNKGIFNLSAIWQRNDKSLTITEGTLAGVLYTLPDNWLSFFAQPAPAWLSTFAIDNFTITQSLLMNIQPEFPFEFTALSGNIRYVDLIKQKQWGIWRGQATFNADAGTINQVMIRRPLLEIASSKNSAAASLSGSIDRGIAKIGLLAQQEPNKVPFELRASGTNIDLGNLNQWGWSGFSPQMWGDFEASLQGDLLASPLASSLNGKLTAVPLQGSRIVRTVVDGYVTSSMASQEPSTESQATPAANTYPVDGHVPTIVTQ
ncbi:AsmA family protein [Providencia alcalifaciens]|uniref:AsmA family protein n=1 Tax=Providencia alcalifaciens DSM 30120 TaxID=520999 RepID=B6XH31_9GAMM|nr:hypothetical protein [Providencia alcalifaciens]ATG15390.1 AsmA family protein [Providencia alcalifaciens]EEB45224.1 hypothetical protein PROVALCAL_02669 [Providencia alcalifaciens DSM 30120]SQI31045.1 AsmA family [Providencia alcalifaciens]